MPRNFPTWSRHLLGLCPSRAGNCPQIARIQIGPRHYAGKLGEFKEFEEGEWARGRNGADMPGQGLIVLVLVVVLVLESVYHLWKTFCNAWLIKTLFPKTPGVLPALRFGMFVALAKLFEDEDDDEDERISPWRGISAPSRSFAFLELPELLELA